MVARRSADVQGVNRSPPFAARLTLWSSIGSTSAEDKKRHDSKESSENRLPFRPRNSGIFASAPPSAWWGGPRTNKTRTVPKQRVKGAGLLLTFSWSGRVWNNRYDTTLLVLGSFFGDRREKSGKKKSQWILFVAQLHFGVAKKRNESAAPTASAAALLLTTVLAATLDESTLVVDHLPISSCPSLRALTRGGSVH